MFVCGQLKQAASLLQIRYFPQGPKARQVSRILDHFMDAINTQNSTRYTQATSIFASLNVSSYRKPTFPTWSELQFINVAQLRPFPSVKYSLQLAQKRKDKRLSSSSAADLKDADGNIAKIIADAPVKSVLEYGIYKSNVPVQFHHEFLFPATSSGVIRKDVSINHVEVVFEFDCDIIRKSLNIQHLSDGIGIFLYAHELEIGEESRVKNPVSLKDHSFRFKHFKVPKSYSNALNLTSFIQPFYSTFKVEITATIPPNIQKNHIYQIVVVKQKQIEAFVKSTEWLQERLFKKDNFLHTFLPICKIGDGINEEDDLVIDNFSISLSCPLSLCRIKLPARTLQCKHAQVFDLFSLLELYNMTKKMECPVCNCVFQLEDVQIDETFMEWLAEIPDYVSTIQIRMAEDPIDITEENQGKHPGLIWTIPSSQHPGSGRQSLNLKNLLAVNDESNKPHRQPFSSSSEFIDLTLSDEEGKDKEITFEDENDFMKDLVMLLDKVEITRLLKERQLLREKISSSTGLLEITTNITRFDELPLSKRTLQGLKDSNYVLMTDVQKQSLPISLSCLDTLGAAKTGSGKTLAFLIPLLEKLFVQGWSHDDGLGAIVLSPTRELALQIFEVLRKIGKYHSFSAGVVIGGNSSKDLEQESKRISRMNILIATPGRILQHMDNSFGFDASNLKMLVLDEADRLLDLGFSKELTAIIDFLPKKATLSKHSSSATNLVRIIEDDGRQTLLFSATQTKSVKDLARLSLTNPSYVGVHEKAETATPAQLQQYFITLPLGDKMTHLYSFIKSHSSSKIIVFVSSCKQVRFLYESFLKLGVGSKMCQLFGRQKQFRRQEIFADFTQRSSAVLFATDVASRGLDFPSVDWVLQFDAPESIEGYIHRVGRSARYESVGNALLFLRPAEEKGMLDILERSKVPIHPLEHKEYKLLKAGADNEIVSNKMAALLIENNPLKYLAERSVVCYLRSIYLQANKEIFKELPSEDELKLFTQSIGLSSCPRLKFVKNVASKQMDSDQEGSFDDSNEEDIGINDNSNEDDILTVKRKNISMEELPQSEITGSSLGTATAKKKKRKTDLSRTRIIYDEDNNAIPELQTDLEVFKSADKLKNSINQNIQKQIRSVNEADIGDREAERMRIKQRKQEKKRKEKALRTIQIE